MSVNTFIWCAVIALLAIAFAGLGHPHQYVFDQAVMKDISREVIAEFPGANATTIVHNVISRLQARYPKYINDEKASEMEWMFNNAGGASTFRTTYRCTFRVYLISASKAAFAAANWQCCSVAILSLTHSFCAALSLLLFVVRCNSGCHDRPPRILL